MRIIYLKNPASGSHFRTLTSKQSTTTSTVKWASCNNSWNSGQQMTYKYSRTSYVKTHFNPNSAVGILEILWLSGKQYASLLQQPTTSHLYGQNQRSPVHSPFLNYSRPCRQGS